MENSEAQTAPAAIIIDDHRALAESLAERLAIEGFHTTVATTVAEGLAASSRQSYDVAFVDLNLPDASGIAAAEELKKRSKDLRVILVTGLAASVDDAEPGWSHIDGVLPKPWKPAELEAILHTLGRANR